MRRTASAGSGQVVATMALLAAAPLACGGSATETDLGGSGAAGAAAGAGFGAAAGAAGSAGTAGAAGAAGAAGSAGAAGAAGAAGSAGAGGVILGDGGLPPDFTPADLGGWRLGPRVPPDHGIDGGSLDRCGSILLGIVRDFQDTHPDFEHYCCGGLKGIVGPDLGADLKPVYASSGGTTYSTGPNEFNQWYRDVDGVNMAYFLYLFFQQNGPVYTFASSAFFPLDGTGFGNQGRNHDFHFTTEIHTEFKYNGGETFTFTGDDDVFAYVNRKLAIDLGGVHPAESEQIDLDAKAQELGIQKGNVYPFDLFHAERHTTESNFRVDTDFDFTSCGIIPIR